MVTMKPDSGKKSKTRFRELRLYTQTEIKSILEIALAEKDKEIARLKEENEELKDENLDKANLLIEIETDNKKAVQQALSELRDFVKERIKNCEQIREDRFDTASLSVGVRNKQFHRTAVKYKGMVIAFNKVLKAIDSWRTA